MAAVDYFLKIDGVEGESADGKFTGAMDLLTFRFGVAQDSQTRGGGLTAGKAIVKDFHFTMNSNKASPKLFQACLSGEHFKKAVLTLRRAGKEQQEYQTFTMSDVVVVTFDAGGGGGDLVPVDEFSLSFAKIEINYRPQKADGSLDAPVKAGWDMAGHKKT